MKKNPDLVQKYNRPAPRYTSYPPVPYWTEVPSEAQWIQHITSTYDPKSGLDLYVHVPFCEKLCYYCGCNRTITKDHGVEGSFLELVLKEWGLYKAKLGFTPRINSLHFGGGTPTFLSPENLERLITELTEVKSEQFIGSIEIDPRTCKPGHLEVLERCGIKRVSLGIQDFDLTVQRAINRIQPVALVLSLLEKLKSSGASSVNFDLVYGLPKQTVSSVTGTINEVIKMRPDLVAFYSYAHLPEKIKNQRLINEDDLPTPAMKRELYETGKELLLKAGYVDVGMDHFALPKSYLYEAKKNNALHRNFMGYVDKKSSVLVGLGPTSISDSSKSFAQNAKELHDYARLLNEGKLPLEKGHVHTQTDLKVQEMILTLMCTNQVTITELPHQDEILKELHGFEEDGIVELKGSEVLLTEAGAPFMRNVALSFDYRYREKSAIVKFSQTI